ncbi:hypothetical protein ACLOJK_013497 [Asimina triloba]
MAAPLSLSSKNSSPLFNMKEGKPPRLIEKIEEAVEAVEEVVEAVEDVAEVVNDVADVIEKVSSDLADDLPKDSMLKRVAEGVEKAADVVGDGAEETIDFINKAENDNKVRVDKMGLQVQDLEEELESKVDNFLYKRLGDILHSLKNKESKEKNSRRIEGKGRGSATAKRGSQK